VIAVPTLAVCVIVGMARVAHDIDSKKRKKPPVLPRERQEEPAQDDRKRLLHKCDAAPAVAATQLSYDLSRNIRHNSLFVANHWANITST
jgi:hypothetical protein